MLRAKKGEDFPKPMVPLCKRRRTLRLHKTKPGLEPADLGSSPASATAALCPPALVLCVCQIGRWESACFCSFVGWAAVTMLGRAETSVLGEDWENSDSVLWEAREKPQRWPCTQAHTFVHTSPHLLPEADTRCGPTLL